MARAIRRRAIRVVACGVGVGVAALGFVVACGPDRDDDGRTCEASTCEGTVDARPATDAADGGTDAADARASETACDGPPGTLDPSFGDGGVALIPIAARGTSILVRSDGSIVVAAEAFPAVLVRLRLDGTIDPSFGDAGIAPVAIRTAPALRAQSDGKLIVAGTSGTLPGPANTVFLVVRHLEDGRADPSFNDGKEVPIGFLNGAYQGRPSLASVAAQSDGRIVVSGKTDRTLGQYAGARLLADGGLDTTFANDGKLVVEMRPRDDAPGVLALGPNGSLVIAGGSEREDSGASPTPRYDLSAARVQADGSLDTSFADAGRLFVDSDASSQAMAAAFDQKGNLLLAGYVDGDLAVFRVTATGALDPTFGDGGAVTLDVDGGVDVATAIFEQPDGKVLVAGSTRVGTSYASVLARYLPNGQADPTFGTGGVATIPLAGGSAASVVESAAVDRCHVVTVGSKAVAAGSDVSFEALVVARWRR